MVAQYSIYSALSMLTKISKTLSSLMMRIRKLSDALCQSSSFLSLKALCLQVSYINGNRLSSSMLSKNMQGKRAISIYAGVQRFKWKFNNNPISLKKQKAPIWRRSFFYIVRCEGKLNNSTLASREFTCNNSVGCYV